MRLRNAALKLKRKKIRIRINLSSGNRKLREETGASRPFISHRLGLDNLEAPGATRSSRPHTLCIGAHIWCWPRHGPPVGAVLLLPWARQLILSKGLALRFPASTGRMKGAMELSVLVVRPVWHASSLLRAGRLLTWRSWALAPRESSTCLSPSHAWWDLAPPGFSELQQRPV